MRKKVVNVITLAVALLTIFQGLLPSLTMLTAGTLTVISAVTLYDVSSLTIWKQKLSEEIQTKAIYPTIAVAMAATFAGAGDLLHLFPFNETTGQLVRFGITFFTMSLNVVSKIFYPTSCTNSLL